MTQPYAWQIFRFRFWMFFLKEKIYILFYCRNVSKSGVSWISLKRQDKPGSLFSYYSLLSISFFLYVHCHLGQPNSLTPPIAFYFAWGFMVYLVLFYYSRKIPIIPLIIINVVCFALNYKLYNRKVKKLRFSSVNTQLLIIGSRCSNLNKGYFKEKIYMNPQ